MASTDRLVSIKADETFPTRVQNAINALIAAGVPVATTVAAGKVRLATVGESTTGTDATVATTPAGVKAVVDAAVANLLNGAPGALDTLKELADAINDDASFAATVTTALSTKVNSSTYTSGLAGKADVSTTPKDLPDTTVAGASGQLAAGVTSNVAAGGAYTSPALDGAVATPPKRFAIKAALTGSCTITLPDSTGASSTVTVLAGEVVTFRQKTTSGWGAESGNKPLTQLDARTQAIIDTGTLRTKTRLTTANYYGTATAANPSYTSHRGDSLLAPEDTMEAFRAVASAGIKAIKTDAVILGDGSLGCLHDATIDRTATTTGNATNFSAQTWPQVAIKGSNLAPAWPDTISPPTMRQVLQFIEDNNMIALIEPKTPAAAQPLIDLATAMGVVDKVVISTSDAPSVVAARAAGFMCALPIGSPSATLPQTQAFKAQGYDMVGIDASSANNPAANATAALPNWLAAGVGVIAYGCQNRYNAAQWVAAGAQHVQSDDLPWVRDGQNGTRTRRTTDAFGLKTWWPGMAHANGVGSGVFTARGYFTGTNKWTMKTDASNTSRTTNGWLAGYICPIASPTAYNLNWNVTFDALDANATAYHFVNIGAAADRLHNGRSDFYKAGGYEINLGQDGNLSLWKDAGSNYGGSNYTQVGTTVATGLGTITAGTTVAMKVQTTSTQIIVSVNGVVKLTATDSSARGAYVYFGRGGHTTASTMQLSLDTVVVS